MFRSYDEIFQQRGLQYHKAMQSYPKARQAEFRKLLEIAQLKAHLTIADIPSGGGYLKQFVPGTIHLIQVETCADFAQGEYTLKVADATTNPKHSVTTLICDELHHIPLPTGHLDRILSLAGLHHLENREAVYREFYRLLTSGGLCCIGEVRKGSEIDRFLNQFVDRYSSLGHQGLFFEKAEVDDLKKAGFRILEDHPFTYPWKFPSQLAMIQFCKDLFGIDQATNDEILTGINHHLDYKTEEGSHQFQWELRFIQAQKS